MYWERKVEVKVKAGITHGGRKAVVRATWVMWLGLDREVLLS